MDLNGPKVSGLNSFIIREDHEETRETLLENRHYFNDCKR